jgi:hypothetical protein
MVKGDYSQTRRQQSVGLVPFIPLRLEAVPHLYPASVLSPTPPRVYVPEQLS